MVHALPGAVKMNISMGGHASSAMQVAKLVWVVETQNVGGVRKAFILRGDVYHTVLLVMPVIKFVESVYPAPQAVTNVPEIGECVLHVGLDGSELMRGSVCPQKVKNVSPACMLAKEHALLAMIAVRHVLDLRIRTVVLAILTTNSIYRHAF